MNRGRLIFPITAEVARLDLAGTAADPDSGGPLTSGYDPVFREPVMLPSSDRLGSSARKEVLVQLPAQIDGLRTQEDYERLQMVASGNVDTALFALIFHFADLEQASLIDGTTGRALIQPGDRLNALYRPDGTLIQSFPDPPGLYVREATPIGIGPAGDRNLLRVLFHSRDPGGGTGG